MAIEYTLHASHVGSVQDFVEALRRQLGTKATTTSEEPAGLDVDGLRVVITKPGEFTARFVHEDYGVMPDVRVLFRLQKDDLEGSQRTLVGCVIASLQVASGDATLLFNGERRVLCRENGVVALDASFSVWTSELREQYGGVFPVGRPLPHVDG
jgi:hypothetical protein